MNINALLGLLVVVITLHYGVTTFTSCDYPTFYDSDSSQCVMTCPNGTYGVVNGASDDDPSLNYTRNCTTITSGYYAIFNATQYESNVYNHSAPGTVVFEALLLIEDPSDLIQVVPDFQRVGPTDRTTYLINGRSNNHVIEQPINGDILITITISDQFDPRTEQFQLEALVFGNTVGVLQVSADVIIHIMDRCQQCPTNSMCMAHTPPDGGVDCVCPTGFTGPNCGDFIGCDPNPCVNGGDCMEVTDNFTCSCPPPLTGRLCEVDPIDECTPPGPCVNGICSDFINFYNCSCYDGYTGTNCTTNINDCDPEPCMNNGSCVDGNNTFTCNCASPWTGDICNTDIDDCIGVNCINGNCVDLVNDFMCQCDQDFEGRFCENRIDHCINVTCLNDGTCIDQVNNFTCQCSPGYEGRLCVSETNECDPNPCGVNSIECIDLFLDYNCTCRQDSTGKNCSERVDDCASQPCQNNATCRDGFASYRCECPEGITGDDCETIIDQCDPDNPCMNNGTCTTEGPSNYTCTCPTGYTSRNCSQLIDYCDGVLCMNNGTCINMPLMGNYSCMCSDGFTGHNCEDEINDCVPNNPCLSDGICTNLVNGFSCDCNPGFTGDTCGIDIDECSPNPCGNNGNCTNLINGYMCTCPDGITGGVCETDIDECFPDPCTNGTCVDLVNGFRCDCDAGFTGDICDVDIDECVPNPCGIGNCTNLINGYMCTCPDGITGGKCETDIDECSPDPCVNGTCIDLVNGFVCDCTAGFTGDTCDVNIDDCTSDPCINGTCIDLTDGFRCDCTAGFTGDTCDIDADDCTPNPCRNNGNCTNLINGYMCTCPDGITGSMCETDINECFPDPCINGTCIDLVNDFRCDCTAEFTGYVCDMTTNDCITDEDCSSGLFCQKSCPTDNYCEHKSLLSSEVTLTGNSYVSVSPSRYPTFTANLAIVARLSQTVNNNGYLLFYGTSDRLRNLAVYLHSNSTVTTLTFYYTDNTGDLKFRRIRFSPSLADGDEHCLVINVSPTQFTAYIDRTSAGFREISSPDFTYGVSAATPAHLLVGGRIPGLYRFAGTIKSVAVFQCLLDAAKISLLCSSALDNLHGTCEPFLSDYATCPHPVMEPSSLCVSTLSRCNPQSACLSDINDDYQCQPAQDTCETDDDCLSNQFCGVREYPAYPSNYFPRNDEQPVGVMTVLVSSNTLFNGSVIIHKPADDHPDVMRDITIFAIVQQTADNDGYVVAKGVNDQFRDFGLYLRSTKQQVWVPYRTVGGSRDIIIFDDVLLDNTTFQSIAVVVDSVNNRCVLYIDGAVERSKSLIGRPEFNPRYNMLYVGGRPGTRRFRFDGIIRYLALQDTVLSHDEISKIHNDMFGITTSTTIGMVNYCTNYSVAGQECRLGDNTDFRCGSSTACIPAVDRDVVLPTAGMAFTLSDIIGYCNSYCDCRDVCQPVCGGDGQTYANRCFAMCAGVEVLDDTGPCTMSYGDLYTEVFPTT